MTPEAVFDWAIQTAVAFVATIAFAIIFHTPREQYVCAGLVGAFSWHSQLPKYQPYNKLQSSLNHHPPNLLLLLLLLHNHLHLTIWI